MSSSWGSVSAETLTCENCSCTEPAPCCSAGTSSRTGRQDGSHRLGCVGQKQSLSASVACLPGWGTGLKLTPGPERQAWKSLRDSQNRRPAATGQRNRGFTKVSDQVCWRTERWHNGRTRHPRNLSCGKVLRGCESSQEKSAAHPIKDTSFGSIKDRIHLRRLNRHLHFSLATTRRTIHSGAPVICPEPGSLADVG